MKVCIKTTIQMFNILVSLTSFTLKLSTKIKYKQKCGK